MVSEEIRQNERQHKIGPMERLKTGAGDLNIETDPGRAEFFALPINVIPGSYS
jgi:hypothetical protein